MIATAIISSIRVNPRERVIAFLCRRRSVKRPAGRGASRADERGALARRTARLASRTVAQSHTLARPRRQAQNVLDRGRRRPRVDHAQRRPRQALRAATKRIWPLRAFLSMPHQLEVALDAEPRARARAAPRAATTRAMRSACAGVDQAEPRRQVGRHRHAAADRLAVQPGAVAGAGLDRVREGVAEVEDRAQRRPRARRRRRPAALIRHERRHRVAERGLVAREQGGEVALDPAEERVVGDRAVLDDLGQARDQLALRQRVERVDVGDRPPAAGGRRRSGSCRADG